MTMRSLLANLGVACRAPRLLAAMAAIALVAGAATAAAATIGAVPPAAAQVDHSAAPDAPAAPSASVEIGIVVSDAYADAVRQGSAASPTAGSVANPLAGSTSTASQAPDPGGPRNPSLLLDAWRRAAQEQGLPATVVTASDIQRAWFYGRRRFESLVLPDGLLREAAPAFVAGLVDFVERGGKVLVVFDAASLGSDGFYPPLRSRLSALCGVDYALYDRLKEATFRVGPVYASQRSMQRLGLPPGKAVVDHGAGARAPFTLYLATYEYDKLQYPSFATQGTYDGEPLLVAADGEVVAGIRSQGRGRVIFANLPLGDLKLATDGWLLNRFLRLLALESGLPTLAMTPGGIGGLVMNLHIDSSAAMGPLRDMAARRFFDDGPFSIHVTAGPDLNYAGDKLGIDVPHNTELDALLRSLSEHGHEIGSHGGWMHNYWATQVTPDSAAQHAWLLERNAQALADAIGKPIRVYSAPVGLHPPWVTAWLREHGFVGYYTTANSGAAPTRMFRDGVLEDRGMWSFPIMTLGVAASFEEAAAHGLDEQRDVIPWLVELTRFAADEREVRLVYFHPTGIHLFENALSAWTAEARALQHAGSFRWYTIGALSEFLDRREQTHWAITRRGSDERIEASTTGTLRDLTWLVPAAEYGQPRIVDGAATVRRDGDTWIVCALGGEHLVFDAARRAALRGAGTGS